MRLVALVLGEPEIRAVAVFLGSLLAIGLLSWWIYRRGRGPAPAYHEMTVLEHLEELRARVLRVALTLVLWSVAFLSLRVDPVPVGPVQVPVPSPSLYDTISARVYAWTVQETVPAHVEIIVTSPTEAVAAQIQVSFLLAFLVTLPLVLYETWAFFAPGLASREQRFVQRALPAALALFGLGAAFAFRFVVPLLFGVLYGFAPALGATAFLAAGGLVAAVTTLVLLFGLAFELPLVMAALVRLGIVEARAYVRKWRHATVGIFIVAALASDPTLTSQLIIGTILMGLYWGGVGLSFMMQPPASEWRPAAAGKTT